jgi:Cu(I)/Ag(I) efflux system membrane protein CusA/SilA
MIGGILTSFALELLVYPVVYQLWKWHFVMKKTGIPAASEENTIQ